MAKIVKFERPSLRSLAEGKTLCKSGFHKWKVVTERKFDVKSGKLVTQLRCERCGEEKGEVAIRQNHRTRETRPHISRGTVDFLVRYSPPSSQNQKALMTRLK